MKPQGMRGPQHWRLGIVHGPWVPPAPKSKEKTVLSGGRGWCVASQPIAAGEQDADLQTSGGSLPIPSLVCRRHPELQQGVKPRAGFDEEGDLDSMSTRGVSCPTDPRPSVGPSAVSARVVSGRGGGTRLRDQHKRQALAARAWMCFERLSETVGDLRNKHRPTEHFSRHSAAVYAWTHHGGRRGLASLPLHGEQTWLRDCLGLGRVQDDRYTVITRAHDG